ncbi:MAG: tRNA (adenosine(37)-N6)-threonylcarbamoyltransferase complex transferase subunit TsaD [Clostridia bacterium]|nr:tRNA (adenosine(37)-N6)-threonylcarbamoyltransferase complex transferase subunit TsaD [Clostridia bacterium]
MLILAIESSCDETACAVVEMSEGVRRILSNSVATQIATHALYGGVVPEIASRCHIEAITPVVREAVRDAGIELSQLDAIAVTYSPGLIGSLLVGVSFAKSLAYDLGLPLIPVDHIKAHTAAAYFADETLGAPFLSLVVSGGHTSIYNVTEPHIFHEIGSTRDDAAGEAFDKVGRVMGLTYPGGAAMDRLATEGFKLIEDGEAMIKFPSPAIPDDTLDYSFSGLKTACINYLHNYRQKAELGDKDPVPEDEKRLVAASFTYTVVNGICSKLETAFERTGCQTLVVAGGVAANSHLRRAIGEICDKNGVKLCIPPMYLCGDNGAMVGAQAYYEYKTGVVADCSLNAYASGEGAMAAAALSKFTK